MRPLPAVPAITDEQREALAECTTLVEAVFVLAEIFQIPLTNNEPHFAGGDASKPVFHVGDFTAILETTLTHLGYQRPASSDRPPASS